jgi:hypothetical protein
VTRLSTIPSLDSLDKLLLRGFTTMKE